MSRVLGWRLGVACVAAVAGLLFVGTARTAQGTDLRGERRTELADLIRAEQARVEDLTDTVDQLRVDVTQLAAVADRDQAGRLTADLDRLSEAVGLQSVRGPGLTVTLNDAPLPVDGIPEGFGGDDFVVHQQDLQSVVNALWAGGAEALAVMDQRLISTSAVRCVGSTLILQGRVYAPPYTVTAVGPTAAMNRALAADPGVSAYREWADLIGLGWAVEEHRTIRVPGYQGSLALQHAEPAR